MNTNAIKILAKIENIREAIFDARYEAIENGDMELADRLAEMSKMNHALWSKTWDAAFPKNWTDKVGA